MELKEFAREMVKEAVIRQHFGRLLKGSKKVLYRHAAQARSLSPKAFAAKRKEIDFWKNFAKKSGHQNTSLGIKNA